MSVLALSALLTACQGEPAGFNISPISRSDVAAVQTIFVATSRKPSDDPAEMFSAARTTQLNYVELDVGIPENHETGKIEVVASDHDPSQHFTLVGRRSIGSADAFRQDLNRNLSQLPAGKRDLFIYVHGYNNSFPSGVYRQSQMLTDFNRNAVALHYSWPSASRAEGYVYDRDSAIFAQNGLADTLRLAVSTRADHITLFAHSMGSLVTMQALRLLAVSGDRKTLTKLDTVVLAAPDVDIDVFDAIWLDLGDKRPREFAVLVSENDGALRFSSTLRGGHPRVGQGESAEFLQERGVIVLDVSDLDGGGHATFAGSPKLIELVRSDALRKTVDNAEQGQDSTVVVNSTGDAAALLVLLPARVLTSVADAASCDGCTPGGAVETQR